MKHTAVFISCSLLLLLFALLGLKLWEQRRRGLRNGVMTQGSYLLGLVYVLLIATVTANALDWYWPVFWLQPLFIASWAIWLGGGLGLLGLLGALMCMRSLGDAFRLGAVAQPTESLVTTGAYAISRNPFFCALFIWYTGMFFLLPCIGIGLVCLLFYLLVHAQTLQEEKALRTSCGATYAAYCKKVSRYFPLSFSKYF